VTAVRLSERAKTPTSLHEARRQPPLTADEEAAIYASRFRQGSDDFTAAEALFCAHIPLVFGLARRFTPDPEKQSELVQEGCIGLWLAIARYDPSRGRLAAFAKPFVWRAMVRAHGLSLVRLPDRVRWRMATVLSIRARLEEEWGRTPNPWEVAQKVRAEASDYWGHHDSPPAPNRAPCAVCTRNSAWATDKQVELLLARVAMRQPGSLSAPRGHGEEQPLPATVDVGRVSEESLIDAIAIRHELVRVLDEREAMVIRSRFGIDTRALTLEEIAQANGWTAEGVRRIQSRALRKLSRRLTADF
jgi:RNA polymerase primary sigma factor